LICNNSYHDKNCPSYNALKGASAVANNNKQPNKQLMFHQDEVQMLAKVFEICKLYINKNSQFQNQDILTEVNESLKILKPNNNLKGASSICPKQSLKNIKNMFGLN
jgi:hypothetical protein